MLRKSLIAGLLIAILSSGLEAGFLSGFMSSAAANALMSNGGKNISIEDKEKLEAKKLQSILELLGFYSYKIDGNLNTFDSRTAIKKWQDSKKTGIMGFFKDKATGILSDEDKNNLLYLADLLLKADGISISKDVNSVDNALERLNDILKEVNKFESQTSSRVASNKLKKNIDRFEKVIPQWKELLNNKNIFYSQKWKKFYYVDMNKKYTKAQSKEINKACGNINVGSLKWELIDRDENNKYSFQDELFPFFIPSRTSPQVNIATDKGTETSVYWSTRGQQKVKAFDWYERKEDSYIVVCKAEINSHLLDAKQ
ncbi:hypothetical protein SMGD1_1990 [Sulfurimonas gotlandica GD1]|uniref:Uncharacterized protein n=1 Tax=Sulfurimonas gotlandica (strain DSM 19862 / JCM 16533 / GD1) TaxID=929558 RepID=B6BJ00_SULGG|nr:peptidoglycan-binding domain-containing protein [Sulfurimonas gotlandica]EDZ63253.1 hypothetical protein CBGD1_872 [Sulfurimonas gotlandica GD1]EHP30513.1 hypothetical protein SMGD1_1990 [Sulfurimonas gotlandica GD1]